MFSNNDDVTTISAQNIRNSLSKRDWTIHLALKSTTSKRSTQELTMTMDALTKNNTKKKNKKTTIYDVMAFFKRRMLLLEVNVCTIHLNRMQRY